MSQVGSNKLAMALGNEHDDVLGKLRNHVRFERIS